MINKETVCNYCCDDISQIENYDKAINDNTQTWHCHHKLETDLGLSVNELINKNLYFDRPASELIFMTKSEHARIHMQILFTINNPTKEMPTDKKEKWKKRISNANKQWHKEHPDAFKGEKNGMFGKHFSEETRKKLSLSHSGEKNGMFGKIGANAGKHRVYTPDGKFHYEY